MDCFVASAPRNDDESSALLRRNIPQLRRMRGNILDAVFEMYPLVRRRMLCDAHAGTPFRRRPDRTRHKPAAAVRADIAELALDAIRTERALIGADPRFRCIRRQILV